MQDARLTSTPEAKLRLIPRAGAEISDVALFGSYIALTRGEEVGFEFRGAQGTKEVIIDGAMPKRSEVKAGLTPDEQTAILKRFDTITVPERLSRRKKLAIGLLSRTAVAQYLDQE